MADPEMGRPFSLAEFTLPSTLFEGNHLAKTTEEVLEMYRGDCPTIRVPKEGEGMCMNCKHCEDDPEIDCCELHNLSHDWDQPETLNFTGFVCDDFQARERPVR